MEMLESRINSVELCEIINEFRIEEKGTEAKKYEHKDLMKKIRKELETMEKLGLGGEGNISPSSYVISQNKKQPCFSLNASGMRQILNSESVYVRCKTEEYITKLETKNRQLQQGAQITEKHLKDMEKRLENKTRMEMEILVGGYQRALVGMQNQMIDFQKQQQDLMMNFQREMLNKMEMMVNKNNQPKKSTSSFNGGLLGISKIVEGTGMSAEKANIKLIEKGILYIDQNGDKVGTDEAVALGICENIEIKNKPGHYFAVYTTKGQKEVKKILGIEEVEQASFDNVINFKK